MKATGIVRRIDDLGRVVIPKEIRRTMRIREGDPLEIYTNSDGEVIFKKYSSIGEIVNYATIFASILNKFIKYPVVITDKDGVIAAVGVQKREYLERRITSYTEEIIDARKPMFSKDDDTIYAIEGIKVKALAIVPIISINDTVGALVILDNGDTKIPLDENIISITAEYLGKQIAD